MGQRVSRTDFEWATTGQPHFLRKKAILEKYPEVKKLYGVDPKFKWVVTLTVLIQIGMLFLVSERSWFVILLAAYCFGGVCNTSLALALHEIGHNQAFGNSKILQNKLFGMFANLPLGIPVSISFRIYHSDHHRYQSVEGMDPDIPLAIEANLFSTTLGKFIWVILQPFMYAIRPFVVNPKKPTPLEYLNLVVQLIFDGLVWYFLGFRAVCYLISGTILASGLHPMAGHYIAEHYMFEKGYETYSYYGFGNLLIHNGGYHMEHHDFPSIPGSRLPELKRIAAEFYDDLPQCHSWTKVIYDFITDPNIGLYSRVVRKRHVVNL